MLAGEAGAEVRGGTGHAQGVERTAADGGGDHQVGDVRQQPPGHHQVGDLQLN